MNELAKLGLHLKRNNSAMTSTHKIPKKNLAVFAIIFLLPALYIFGLWIKVYNQNADSTPAERVAVFTDQFPLGFNDIKIITLISMACCIVAMVLAAKSFKQRLVSLRILMFITVIVAALIFLLDVFQLM